MQIYFYNSLTKKKEQFESLEAGRVGMYVCGPTVYSRPHIGNARSVVVYDLVFRLLRYLYGEGNITYVRNITDVDDKINEEAKKRGGSINILTSETTKFFHQDMAFLHCLPPTIEPRATLHIREMIEVIERLLAGGHAYINDGHVFFAVNSYQDYGKLAATDLDELLSGVRIEVSELKKHPHDFVLWKPAGDNDDPSSIFLSPWGKGRPGWHIECSAMSNKYLGQDFDIHGGGMDLMFPHHTNEIAQSCAAYPGSQFARYWLHNGFVTIDGEKMSKSLGNIITVQDLKEHKGEALRYIFLTTHYRKPLDWTTQAISDAKKSLDSFYRALEDASDKSGSMPEEAISYLADDLNTAKYVSLMHQWAKDIHKTEDLSNKRLLQGQLASMGKLLGFFNHSCKDWFAGDIDGGWVDIKVKERHNAKKAKNFDLSDQIRNELIGKGVILEDLPDGSTKWRKV